MKASISPSQSKQRIVKRLETAVSSRFALSGEKDYFAILYPKWLEGGSYARFIENQFSK